MNRLIKATFLFASLAANPASAQTHVVYLNMMMMPNGVPRQMEADRSMEDCMATITKQAARETGDNRHTWYCQPAVANTTLGPN